MKVSVYILIFLSVFTFALAGYKTYVSLSHPVKYRDEIIEFSKAVNISNSLIASVINVESSYKKDALSQKGAIGLMQLKLSTAEYVIDYYDLELEIDENDLYLPEKNIYLGCMYLRYLTNKFEDPFTALAAYNAGETRVRVWLSDENYSSDGKILDYIPYGETRNYIKKIKKNLKFYSKIYKN